MIPLYPKVTLTGDCGPTLVKPSTTHAILGSRGSVAAQVLRWLLKKSPPGGGATVGSAVGVPVGGNVVGRKVGNAVVGRKEGLAVGWKVGFCDGASGGTVGTDVSGGGIDGATVVGEGGGTVVGEGVGSGTTGTLFEEEDESLRPMARPGPKPTPKPTASVTARMPPKATLDKVTEPSDILQNDP